jgi:hypothetical protein
MTLRQSIESAGNVGLPFRIELMSVLLLIILFFGLVPLHGAGVLYSSQATQTTSSETSSTQITCPSGLQVTYVSANPSTVTVGTTLVVTFRVIYGIVEEYLGCISNPVTGLKTGSFILSPEGTPLASMLGALASLQSTERLDVPLFPGAVDGEYRAEIRITQNDPVGNVLVYVKDESLRTTVNDKMLTGPITNVSSVQTEDTSDYSVVDVKQIEQPSVWTQLMQSDVLPLLIFAALIFLILFISIIARRRRKTAASSKVAAKT